MQQVLVPCTKTMIIKLADPKPSLAGRSHHPGLEPPAAPGGNLAPGTQRPEVRIQVLSRDGCGWM